MSEKTVFISYSHDTPEHGDRVRGLSASLSRDGCGCRLDVFKDTGEDWPAWMTRQLIEADFVLCVVTETYARRFRDQELPDRGLGVGWEAGLIRRLLYAKKLHNSRIFPVLFAESDRPHIPIELEGYDCFLLDSPDGYEPLLRKVLNRPLHAKPDTGPAPNLGTRTTAPSFPRHGETPPSTGVALQASLSRLTHAAEKLVGRETELRRLDAAWRDPAQHVLIIRGIGGEGKTSLAVEWAGQLASRGYDGASYFDWSFYSQGTRDQTSASSEPFIAAALGFFGGDEGKALANSAAGARDKAGRLLEYLRARRTLLVLDGLEPLQYPPGPLGGQLRDEAMAVLLKGLAQNSPGLCVVTTREPVTDLARFHDSTAPEWELEHLSEKAGSALLQRLLEPPKPKGVHQVPSTAAERAEICRALKGHALTLRLLGGFIHRALRDVRRWREVDYSAADAQLRTNPRDPNARYGHAFKTVEAYEHWFARGGVDGARQLAVLRLLGLFDRPASGALLAALRRPPVIPGLTESLAGLSEPDWNTTLSELEECGLVSLPKTDATLPLVNAHPLLREYFAKTLCAQQPEAWRAAHRRLYEYLCATTKEGNQPTLEDLQPLYQAVAHGCLAGLQQAACTEVYFIRILKQNEHYSWRKLGAFGSDLGAVACFFKTIWRSVSPSLTEADQAWTLAQSALYLRALGRLTEALEPMQTAQENLLTQKNWKQAAINSSNLSELELTLGEMAGAVGDAEQSVTYADRSGDAFQRMVNRCTSADALHQAGHRTEAEARFREAEQMQAERQPTYPLLYSLGGFHYCDLLLTEAERAAWQWILESRASVLECGAAAPLSSAETAPAKRAASSATSLSAAESAGAPAHSKALRAVSERAAQTLKWMQAWQGAPLLDIALDHLTLGRAALYAAILEQSAIGHCQSAIASAISGLRRSSRSDILPHGLLTRAWQRFLTGAHTGPESAQNDLDEAWEIAERGPMPLFMADIHLYRARLFGRRKTQGAAHKDEAAYPWDSPEQDLAEARRLIEKHGYLRRMEELQDAEAALNVRP